MSWGPTEDNYTYRNSTLPEPNSNDPRQDPRKSPWRLVAKIAHFPVFCTSHFRQNLSKLHLAFATFRKFVRTLGAGLCLPKSSIYHGSDPGPPKTHHHGIFTTLPLAHTPILVCLRFGLMSSREDLSRLWNWLFHWQGPIPVRMVPRLTALF